MVQRQPTTRSRPAAEPLPRTEFSHPIPGNADSNSNAYTHEDVHADHANGHPDQDLHAYHDSDSYQHTTLPDRYSYFDCHANPHAAADQTT
jgi:hypothetical protein